MSLLCRILVAVLLGCSEITKSSQTTWRYKTACYGSDPDCSDYKIECGDGEYILIGSLQYGGKRTIQRCQFGLSDCKETLTLGNTTKTVDDWCCTYDPHDYLTNFSVENRTSVISNCNGRQTCTGSVPRIFKVTYSSYIWMQYTCLSDYTSAKMCKTSNRAGSDVFVTFNLSQGYIFPSLNGSRDCSCQVNSLDCFSNLELTIHALNFKSTTTANHSLCSNAILELAPSLKLNCSSHNSLPATYRIMSWKDTVAIRHLFTRDAMDRPDFIVIQIKAVNTASPVSVECYPPGMEPMNDLQCRHTTEHTSPVSTSTLVTRTKTSTTSSTSSFETVPTVATVSTPTMDVSTTHSTILNTVNITGTKSGYQTVTMESTLVPGSHTRDVKTTPLAEKHTRDNLKSVSQTTNTNSVATSNTTDVVSTKYEFSSDTISTLSLDYYVSSSDRGTTNWWNSISRYSKGTIRNGHSSYSAQVTGFSPTVVASDNSLPIRTSSIHHNKTMDNTTPSLTDTRSGSGSNDRLIIGLTVGIVLAIVILVAVISICCFIRLKRKEKVQRSYVQNTSIFYSGPEDYVFTENVSYEPTELGSDTGNHESTNPLHSSMNGGLTSSSTCSIMDRHSTEKYYECLDQPVQAQLDLLEDNFQGEVANSTITLVNDIEPEARHATDNGDINHANGNPVTHPKLGFDPHSLYSKVRKEGKTKF